MELQNIESSSTKEVFSSKSEIDPSAKIYIFGKIITSEEAKTRKLILLESIDDYHIYIQQVFLNPNFETVYDDHPTHFLKLKAAQASTFEHREHKAYKSSRITASLIELDNGTTELATQNINWHLFNLSTSSTDILTRNFNLNTNDLDLITSNLDTGQESYCLREACKNVRNQISKPEVVSEMSFYSVCPGCDFPNHSEAQLFSKISEAGKIIDCACATVYLYGHWWCCEPCGQKLSKLGVSKVVISKEWTREYLQIDKIYKSFLSN